MFVVQYAQILEKNRGIFRVFLCKMTKVICLTIWYNCTKISIQFCELCTQLKCYKNVTNCYKIVTPTFQKFFFLIQKIPTAKIYQQLIHTLSTHLSTIDTWEIPQYRKEKTMQVLQRLKMELSNQEYFSDEQYIQFLTENSLAPTDEYDKPTMQKNLLYTVLDVLEAVTNDIDLMTGISTEFSNIGQAYEFLEARIQ